MVTEGRKSSSGETEGGRRPTGVSPDFPDPEVSVYKTRRRLTDKYKREVVKKVDQLRSEGGHIGAYLRSEGLYYSNVRQWAIMFSSGHPNKKSPCRSNARSKEELKKENLHLKHELEKTRKKLIKTEMIVDIQKKISEMIKLENDEQ